MSKHNKAAGASKGKSRVWLKVANETLKRTGSDAKAVRAANTAAKLYGGKK